MIGIALEGGAERSSFTAGVIDALMARNFYAAAASGTSAGAGCVLNYRSRQQGVSLEMMIMERHSRYFGIRHMAHTGRFLNLDHMAQEYASRIDWTVYQQFGTTCVAGMKNAVLGMDDRTVELQQQFNALVSRYQQIYGGALVELDGKHYIDGSIADPIPFLHLLEQGCDKVIVVLTGSEHARPTDYTRLRPLLRQLYAKKYPMLYHAILHQIARYEEQVQALKQAQQEQRTLVLRPQIKSIPLFTQNEDKIRAYYQHGCELVEQRWTEITAFLENRTLTQ